MGFRYKYCSFRSFAFLIVILYIVIVGIITGIRIKELASSSSSVQNGFIIGSNKDKQNFGTIRKQNRSNSGCEIDVAIILCNATNVEAGNGKHKTSTSFQRQINQTVVLVKSLLISALYDPELTDKGNSELCLQFHIIVERKEVFDYLITAFSQASRTWDAKFQSIVSFKFVQLRYPSGTEWMKKLFRPCATARLFIPHILPGIEKVLYLDTDFIFLKSIQTLWEEFQTFNERTVAGMSPCLNHYGTARNKIPYYGKTGVNAGLMLMNLSKMRANEFDNKIMSLTKKYRYAIKLADQDILNIYFHDHPEELQEVSCVWNFRPFQCLTGNGCDSALVDGIHGIHGNALSFVEGGMDLIFYKIFQEFYRSNALQDPSFNFNDFKRALAEISLNTDPARSPCSQYELFRLVLINH